MLQPLMMRTPHGGGILHLTGSMFWGSVQKPPGTEVKYDRDSTSYSSAEQSWAPTEKIYGKDAFVRQSVWSDNKYDILLGNKTHDVMGFDVLYDNIIPDESPDDDEELFEANEFLGLNEYTDPDMGLKFQARQA